MKLNVPAVSVRNVEGRVYVTTSDGSICTISELKGGDLRPIASLVGYPCTILWGSREGVLVSAEESLYLVSEGEAKIILRTRPGNWFWHGVEACGKVFIQEYGEPPTGIYVSEDLETFVRIITNKDVDPLSRHFHYISFDRSRGVLIATLGDGNVVRVAISSDCGFSWRPLYKGPWQFVPVFTEGSRWIFGFDSGIVRGGVAIYNVDEGKWRFYFLRANGYRYAQFTSITKFNDYYVGCLGYPTAILVSKDLLHWHLLYLDETFTSYNHFVNAITWKGNVIAVTGKSLLIFDSKDVKEAFEKKPFLVPYRAHFEMLKGLMYTLKRILRMKRL